MTDSPAEICIALIGAGRIGTVHAQNIARSTGLSLKYISDPDEAAAQTLASATGATVVDTDRIWDDQSVKGVVIASSTDTHAGLIEQAAKAGKAIFCEKPVDLNLERVEQCLATVKDHSVQLLIGFNRRFDPQFAALKKRLQDGEIGSLELLLITSRDPSPPPTDYIARSGGLFRDMTIHDFDMARWLLGDEPVSVQATGSCQIDPAIAEQGDIDTAIIVLKTAGGAICCINNSRRAVYGYDQRIEAFGSKGMLQVHNLPQTHVSAATAQGFLHSPAEHFFLERYAAAYAREIDHFAQILRGETTPLTTGGDGRQALALAEAANESLAAGKTVTL